MKDGRARILLGGSLEGVAGQIEIAVELREFRDENIVIRGNLTSLDP